MAKWESSGIDFTINGQKLVNQAAAGNGRIVITRVTSSDTRYSGMPEFDETLNNVERPMQDFTDVSWHKAMSRIVDPTDPDKYRVNTAYVLEFQLRGDNPINDKSALEKDENGNSGYYLKQIGVFAKLINDRLGTESEEVLLLLAQTADDAGQADWVDVEPESNFVMTYAIQFNLFANIGDAVSVNVTMDNAGMVSVEQFNRELNRRNNSPVFLGEASFRGNGFYTANQDGTMYRADLKEPYPTEGMSLTLDVLEGVCNNYTTTQESKEVILNREIKPTMYIPFADKYTIRLLCVDEGLAPFIEICGEVVDTSSAVEYSSLDKKLRVYSVKTFLSEGVKELTYTALNSAKTSSEGLKSPDFIAFSVSNDKDLNVVIPAFEVYNTKAHTVSMTDKATGGSVESALIEYRTVDFGSLTVIDDEISAFFPMYTNYIRIVDEKYSGYISDLETRCKKNYVDALNGLQTDLSAEVEARAEFDTALEENKADRTELIINNDSMLDGCTPESTPLWYRIAKFEVNNGEALKSGAYDYSCELIIKCQRDGSTQKEAFVHVRFVSTEPYFEPIAISQGDNSVLGGIRCVLKDGNAYIEVYYVSTTLHPFSVMILNSRTSFLGKDCCWKPMFEATEDEYYTYTLDMEGTIPIEGSPEEGELIAIKMFLKEYNVERILATRLDESQVYGVARKVVTEENQYPDYCEDKRDRDTIFYLDIANMDGVNGLYKWRLGHKEGGLWKTINTLQGAVTLYSENINKDAEGIVSGGKTLEYNNVYGDISDPLLLSSFPVNSFTILFSAKFSAILDENETIELFRIGGEEGYISFKQNHQGLGFITYRSDWTGEVALGDFRSIPYGMYVHFAYTFSYDTANSSMHLCIYQDDTSIIQVDGGTNITLPQESKVTLFRDGDTAETTGIQYLKVLKGAMTASEILEYYNKKKDIYYSVLLPYDAKIRNIDGEIERTKEDILSVDTKVDSITSTTIPNLESAFNKKLNNHTTNTNNPHGVTKEQVGLENVNNTADIDKPVSTATWEALNLKADKSTIIPNNDLESIGEFNKAGWYRVAISNDGNGNTPNSCEIIISRYFNYYESEYHHIYFSGVTYKKSFNSISNSTSTRQLISKIRYINDGSNGYLDIYQNIDCYNGVSIKINNGHTRTHNWQVTFDYIDTSEITNSVIYNIPANGRVLSDIDVDATPTENSANPVSSGGVYTALGNKADKSSIIENDNFMVLRTASTSGWYRLARFNGFNDDVTKGSVCNSCEIVIQRAFGYTNNEYHHLYFTGIFKSRHFSSISDKSNYHLFDKIRYVEKRQDDGTYYTPLIAYIDVHYTNTTTNGNDFSFKILNGVNSTFSTSNTRWENCSDYVGVDDIEGQVVYDIPANSKLAQKTDTPFLGTCASVHGNTAKVVDCPEFTLQDGARIAVIFANGNSANYMTLNVNNTGAYFAWFPIGSTRAYNDPLISKMIVGGCAYEFIYQGGSNPKWVYCGATNIPADGSVTTDKIADDAVKHRNLADNSVTTTTIADASVNTNKLSNVSVTSGKLAASAVITEKIKDKAVTKAKLADEVIELINSSSSSTVEIADGSITSAKIADGAITTAKLEGSSVTYEKIALNSISEGELRDNAVTTNKIKDEAVTSDKIGDSSITSAKIKDFAVTNKELAGGAVTSDKIASASIVSNKIAEGAVTEDKLSEGLISRLNDIETVTKEIGVFDGYLEVPGIEVGSGGLNGYEVGCNIINACESIKTPTIYVDELTATTGTAGGRVTANYLYYKVSCSKSSDYAVCKEWADGNPENEDRVGRFAIMEGEYIRIANSSDTDIRRMGIISGSPCIIENSAPTEWKNKYLTDVYGRVKTQTVHYPTETRIKRVPVTDENGNTTYEEKEVVVREERDVEEPIINPEWDETLEYIPRMERPEFDAVGVIGILVVDDDGTCVVGGYCMPNDEGIATASSDGFYVEKRIDDSHIKVFVR